MKISKRFGLLILLSILQIGLFSGCSSPVSKKETNSKLLQAYIWKLSNVTIDNTQSNLYQGLTVDFAEFTFATVNGGAIWPKTGKWEFTDNTASAIIRNDGLEMTISQLSNKGLVLTFLWSKTTLSGRNTSLVGLHRMTFVPN